MEQLTPGKHYFVRFSERIDQFARKRYTSPSVEQWRYVILQGRLIEQRGSQIKLHLTGNNGFERDEQEWVFNAENLLCAKGGSTARTLEDHGASETFNLGVWQESPPNEKITFSKTMNWIYDDGGRAASDKFRGKHTKDCVARSIAIVTQIPYFEVYLSLMALARQHERRSKHKKRISSPREGVYKPTIVRYLRSLGYTFVPLMTIGSGCKYHLRESELPLGRLIVSVSGHYTAVIDRTIHDTHDPSRSGTRCVYGYWHKPSPVPAFDPASTTTLDSSVTSFVRQLPTFTLPENLLLRRFTSRT